jgi:hypothetical protein
MEEMNMSPFKYVLRLTALLVISSLLISCGEVDHTKQNVENLLTDLSAYPNLRVKGEVSGTGTINGLEISYYDMRWNRSQGYVRSDKAVGRLTYEQLDFAKYEVDGIGLPKRIKMTASGIDVDVPGATEGLRYAPDEIRALILQFFKADKSCSLDLTFDNSALNLPSFELVIQDMATLNATLDVENLRATMFGSMAMDGFKPETSDIVLPRINSASIKITFQGGLKDLIAEYLGNLENEVQMVVGQLKDNDLAPLATTVENFVLNPESLTISMAIEKDFTLQELMQEIEMIASDPVKIKDFLANDLNLIIQ